MSPSCACELNRVGSIHYVRCSFCFQFFAGAMHKRCYREVTVVQQLGGSLLCDEAAAASTPFCNTNMQVPLAGLGTPRRIHALALSWGVVEGIFPPPNVPLEITLNLSRLNASVDAMEVSQELLRPSWGALHERPSDVTWKLCPDGSIDAESSNESGSGGASPPFVSLLPANGISSQWAELAISSEFCGRANSAATVGPGANLVPAVGAGIALRAVSLEVTYSERDPVDDFAMCCGDARVGNCDGYKCQPGRRCLWSAAIPNGLNSFDNSLHAFITIFQVISLEGWVDIMYMLQDSTSAMVFIYFVILVIIGAFFLVNLFLAVIFESFHKAQVTQEAELETKRRQMMMLRKLSSYSMTRKSLATRIQHYKNSFYERGRWWLEASFRPAAVIAKSRWFERISLILILTNTVVLGCYHAGMSGEMERQLSLSNLVLTQFFALELLVKLAACGFSIFFKDLWCTFDAVVVVISELELVIDFSVDASVFRTLRLLRVMKLARSMPGLRQIVTTVMSSLNQVSSSVSWPACLPSVLHLLPSCVCPSPQKQPPCPPSMAHFYQLVNRHVSKQVVNFLFIFGLTVFIFALLGMELFAERFTEVNGFAPLVQTAHGDLVPEIKTHFDTIGATIIIHYLQRLTHPVHTEHA